MSNNDIRKACPLPRSGLLLKALVDIADLNSDGVTSNEGLGNRSSRRVFLGDRVKEGSLKSLVEEISRALISSELIPLRQFRELLERIKSVDLDQKEAQLANLRLTRIGDPRIPQMAELLKGARKEPVNLESILSKKILASIQRYEAFASSLSTIPPPHPNATWAALRLATVDLGMRYGAILLIEDRKLTNENVPMWAKPDGPSQKLRDLFSQCVPSVPRRPNNETAGQDWTTLLGVSASEVDRYFGGNDIPSPVVIKRLAKELARRIKGRTEHELLLELRGHFAACHLASAVARHIGRPKMEEMASALCRIAQAAAETVRQNGVKEESARQAAFFTLIDGCEIEPARYVLNFIAMTERDPLWKGDILALRDGRIFERIVHYVRITKEVDAQPFVAPTIPDLAALSPEQLKELRTRIILASDVSTQSVREGDPPVPGTFTGLGLLEAQLAKAWQAGDASAAESLLRKGIKEQPDNSGYHYSLGQLLMDRDEFVKSKAELWLGVNLCPTDERPYTDIAACLLKEQKFDEAVKHLEAKPDSLSKEHSGLYAHWLGRAFFYSGQLKDALKHFESAIAAKQDLDISYDLAARAAFLIGENSKGKHYAKNAKSLGCSDTFDMWKKGEFG